MARERATIACLATGVLQYIPGHTTERHDEGCGTCLGCLLGEAWREIDELEAIVDYQARIGDGEG